jgi:hypothetical protein
MPTLRSRRFNGTIDKNTLAGGYVSFVDFGLDPEISKELPLNNILIRNFSGQRLKVEYGKDTVAYVGGNEVYVDDAAYGLVNLKITNTETAANSDVIFWQVSRVVTGDMAMIAMATGENILKIANGGV